MLERAVRLSESAFGMMNLYENGRFKGVALRGVPPGILSFEAASKQITPDAVVDAVLAAVRVP